MNSQCAIQHAERNSIFAIYLSQESESDREIHLQKSDLSNIKVLGIIASVKDPKTGYMVQLAYEPYVVMKSQVQGIRRL